MPGRKEQGNKKASLIFTGMYKKSGGSHAEVCVDIYRNIINPGAVVIKFV